MTYCCMSYKLMLPVTSLVGKGRGGEEWAVKDVGGREGRKWEGRKEGGQGRKAGGEKMQRDMNSREQVDDE